MELKELRSFCTVARLRSMTKAAEFLDIGQPTVTVHIRKLEQDLGLTLLNRVRRPLELTSAGAVVAEMAMSHVDALDSLRSGALKAEVTHDVSVVSAHDLIPHTLLRIVRAFRTRYPDVQINIRSGLSRDIRRLVADGIMDVGFVSRPVKSPELEYHRLFSYEHVLITPPGHPLLDLPEVTLGDIARWPLILTQPGRFTRELLETEFRRLGHDYDVVMALPDMDMIKPYVAMGLGVSVGDSLAIEPEDEAELGVISLAGILPIEEAGFVTLRGGALSTTAQRFIEMGAGVAHGAAHAMSGVGAAHA
jgi:DNA-binding transcriptional LysR family regulator